MYHYRTHFAVVLAVILSNAAFGTPFRILDPRFQYANKDTTKTKGKSSDLALTETSLDDDNNFNNSVPKLDFSIPMPEEVMSVDSTDPRQFYHGPPSYPSFYTANSENMLPVENSLPETYQNGNSYNAYPYYPSVESFPTPHPYILEDIRYVPAYQELYNYIHRQPVNTPLPYVQTVSSNPGPSETGCKMEKVTDNTPYLQASFTDRTPYNVDLINSNIQTSDSENELARPTTNAAIEDYMMKKILEIVNDLSRSNVTLNGGHSPRDDTYLPRKNMSIVATTSVNQNNTTRIESTIGFDETETEIHSGGNRTVTSEIAQAPIGQKMKPTMSTTVRPQRYLVRQFTDKSGNPCMEELVTTSGKKLYSVYTCENNKGIPRKTTTSSDVAAYRDEIKPDFETTADTKTDDETTAETRTDEPATTTPMTADQTIPPVLNDYAIFNMQQ